MAQRLLLKEIDNRVRIRLDKSIRRDGVSGVMLLGENNDYPQIMERLINGSITAKATSNVYAKFLTGQGFENTLINDIPVGIDSRGKIVTLHNLLRQVSVSVAKHNGFYIHCNWKLDNKIKNVHLKPFKDIRFSKPDETGFSAKVCYYNNWEKDKDKGNYNKDKIKEFNVFNPYPVVLQNEIKKAGGIEKYKGQIYFEFLDNEYFYPLSNFDEVYLDLDTENQISLYKNRQIRDGFFDKVVFRVAPGGTEEEKVQLADNIRAFMGPDGETVLILEDDLNEQGEIAENGSFRIDKIESNINDKLFESWEKSLANNIRKAAKGVPAILIDYEQSNLGNTSGEAVREAANFYNALTSDDREVIENSFKEIFKHFDNPILSQNTNWKIKPLNLIQQKTDGITDITTTTGNQAD